MTKQEFTEFHDVSRKQREVSEWRYARKLRLREEYLKQTLNPINQTMPKDDALTFMTQTRIQHEFTTHLKFRPHALSSLSSIVMLFGGAHILYKFREYRNNLYGSGDVSYADRVSKFG